MLALVVAVAIESRAALQAPLGDGDGLARDVADGGSAKRRREAKARNLIAQGLAFAVVQSETSA